MTQPTALFLADALETAEISYTSMVKAAAELRRLYAELERCKQVCAATSEGWRSDTDVWKAQRDALLEALRVAVDSDLGRAWVWPDTAREQWMRDARAAIAKAEENI